MKKFLLLLPFLYFSLQPRAQDDELQKILTNNGYDLLYYSSINDIKKVKNIINVTPQVIDFTDDDGATALMFAAQAGNDSIILYLISKGANINLKTKDYNTTALICAVNNDNLRSAEILIRNGANIDDVDIFNRTALHYSTIYGYGSTTDMLLYYDADVNIQDDWGYSPLFYAVEYNDSYLTDLLIKNGADINIVSANGSSLLHVAAYNNNLYFLNNYYELVNIKRKNNNAGYSPIEMSLTGGNSEALEFFLNSGEILRDTINEIYSPLTLAKSSGDKGTKKVIRKMKIKDIPYLYLRRISIGYNFIFNRRDFFMNPVIGLHEDRYGLSAEIGYMFRGYERRILLPVASKEFHQLRESRNAITIGLTKDFKIDNAGLNSYWSIFFKIKALYFWGKYDGMDLKIKNDVVVSPAIGINLNSYDAFRMFFEISYMDMEIYDTKSLFYSVGFKGLINFRHKKTNEKYKYIINF